MNEPVSVGPGAVSGGTCPTCRPETPGRVPGWVTTSEDKYGATRKYFADGAPCPTCSAGPGAVSGPLTDEQVDDILDADDVVQDSFEIDGSSEACWLRTAARECVRRAYALGALSVRPEELMPVVSVGPGAVRVYSFCPTCSGYGWQMHLRAAKSWSAPSAGDARSMYDNDKTMGFTTRDCPTCAKFNVELDAAVLGEAEAIINDLCSDGTDVGVYPKSWIGPDGSGYEKRDAFKEGWNAAIKLLFEKQVAAIRARHGREMT